MGMRRKLTEREIEWLKFYAAGIPLTAAASAVSMSRKSVWHIRRALGADTMPQALAIAIRRGIIA